MARRDLDAAFFTPLPGEELVRTSTAPEFPRAFYPLPAVQSWLDALSRDVKTLPRACRVSTAVAEGALVTHLDLGGGISSFARPAVSVFFGEPSAEAAATEARVESVSPDDLAPIRQTGDATLVRAAFGEHAAFLTLSPPGDGELPLPWWAVQKRRLDLLDVVIELGFELDTVRPRVGSLLHLAASWGFPEVIERLIAAGADPNVTSLEGLKPLHHALKSASRDADREHFLGIHDLLVKLGASEDSRDGDALSPSEERLVLDLQQAIKACDIARVRAVLESPMVEEARIRNIADAAGGVYTPFERAISITALDIAECLLPHTAGQASLDAALGIAVGHNAVDAARWLLERGAASTQRGLLHAAAAEPNRRMTELLLDCGADPNAVDDEGSTPLIRASRRPFGHKTAALLLERGADPSLEDPGGRTALDHALSRGHTRTVDALTKGSG